MIFNLWESLNVDEYLSLNELLKARMTFGICRCETDFQYFQIYKKNELQLHTDIFV